MNANDAISPQPARPAPDLVSMRERFVALWRRNLPSGAEDRAEAVWRALEAHYSQPHRHYHHLGHLALRPNR